MGVDLSEMSTNPAFTKVHDQRNQTEGRNCHDNKSTRIIIIGKLKSHSMSILWMAATALCIFSLFGVAPIHITSN